MTAPTGAHPPWCVPHECTVLADTGLPAADGLHHSQTVTVPSLAMTTRQDTGPITAWLTERPGRPDSTALHLHSALLGHVAVVPISTAARALDQLGHLVGQADPGTPVSEEGPRRTSQRPMLQLVYPADITAERQLEEQRRRLGDYGPGW